MIESRHLKIHPATAEEMERFIARQTVDALREAYTEMLQGAQAHPQQWSWYAIWMIELSDGTHVGELCFMGLGEEGATEIGYGIAEPYRGPGYATEAVNCAVAWALQQSGVTRVEAETEADNMASQRVLAKCGFQPKGVMGEEGPVLLAAEGERLPPRSDEPQTMIKNRS